MTPLPILYSFRRCPYAMRARLAIAVSGQRCELREIVLRNKPPEMLAASPKATVPVLVLADGQVIDQSLDIMRWALQQHDPEGWLAADRATLDSLIAANDGPFKRDLDRYKYPNRYAAEHAGDDKAFAEAHRSSAARWLMELDARLNGHGWLCGASVSLADMAILPFVRQFAHTDAAWFAAQPWPNLLAWLARWEAGPLLVRVMGKYPPWQAGLAGVEFPPIAPPPTEF
ncbi:Glutathione S-transferase [Polaromonas sp. OV174]|uniref:glutathione S-transferase n=1 Tax=Polaromonas sp. OV174 TaxID=1855300 RepID=UPI0008F17253|nr:glutathione S-transferase [Polaromonas sp. OV174]SFC23748.1 Glutathione S-transferase [Polaromonas sp. OV174]